MQTDSRIFLQVYKDYMLCMLFFPQRNQDLNMQVGTLSNSEGELLEANHRLREMLERLKEELRSVRSQAEKAQHETER